MHSAEFSPPTRAWLGRGRHVSVGRHNIFVFEQGAGPTLLLLHGFPTSSYDWRGIVDRLAERNRCVAFDFPGYGLSDKPEDYSYSLFQQADVVEGLAAELKIDAAHVVSHDMGTSVHCELLARQSRKQLDFRITASTFTNGSMLQWLATITPLQKLLAANETLPQAIEICNGDLSATYVPALRAITQRPEMLTDEDALVMTELLTYAEGAKRLPALAGYMRERYVHADRWLTALGGAEASLQFIWADGDPIANVTMGRELSRMYPKARYVELAGLGHFVIFEDPGAVAREIEAHGSAGN